MRGTLKTVPDTFSGPMTTNGTSTSPPNSPNPRASLFARLSFPHLWFIAVGTWIVFGLLLLLRSSNSEIVYVLFVASAVPVAVLIRRRWFKKWLFVTEETLLIWGQRLCMLSLVLLAMVVAPTSVLMCLHAMGVELFHNFNGVAFYLLASLVWTIAVVVLGSGLLLQFITGVWNLRWTVTAILAHILFVMLIVLY